MVAAKPSVKVCKDCRAEVDHGAPARQLSRPATYPGPRCKTHHYQNRRKNRISRAVKRVEDTYNLTAEEYDALYRFQGGRCALCRIARGTGGKRLAVDHDHSCCVGPKSCGKCVRGLVCSTCNDVLAHFRDSPAAGYRIAAYLERSPLQRFMDGNTSWVPGIPS